MGQFLYSFPVLVGKQDDGLWRVECPALQGCFVDDPSLDQALADMYEVMRTFVEIYREEGRPLPEPLDLEASWIAITLPIVA